ncbi:unnamed protein product [Pleuronectes platessa]|uniref:Uncharacterized protein n=1 Tax=Pleuronectes platessa TaxID=8262 RepID=A0A9N7VGY7_PLEPL|nr:unnamed protein product [Pleuronectes platessa]
MVMSPDVTCDSLGHTCVISRTTAVATSSWIAICGSRVGGHGGGSSVVDSMSCQLIVVGMTDPLCRWREIMVVDHDRGDA